MEEQEQYSRLSVTVGYDAPVPKLLQQLHQRRVREGVTAALGGRGRLGDGEQVTRVTSLVIAKASSVDLSGHRQRHIAA